MSVEIEYLIDGSGNLKARIVSALGIIIQYGSIDGDHHKAWVLDQVTRALADERYPELVSAACEGENGPETYEWNTGIAP